MRMSFSRTFIGSILDVIFEIILLESSVDSQVERRDFVLLEAFIVKGVVDQMENSSNLIYVSTEYNKILLRSEESQIDTFDLLKDIERFVEDVGIVGFEFVVHWNFSI
uniref:Uncharacterized protein n=1 Tax=Rhizobium phage IG49 TaxID=3129228 RepID=A0AAU8HYY4_9CAUD